MEVIGGVALYLLVGICWLPVVYLQIRMRDLAEEAFRKGTALSAAYWKLERLWFWLGVIAFPTRVVIFHLMVFKPNT